MKHLLIWARLSIATALATMALKFGAWALTGSVGLLSDALESIVNLVAASLAFALLKLAHAPADANHAFGHEKAEYFSSGAEGALIMAAGVAIVGSALDRWLHPQAVEQLPLGMLVAALAAVLNGICGVLLLRAGRRYASIALEADGHHLLSDVWTTAGIVAALMLVQFFPSLSWLDPAAAIVLALYLFRTGWLLLRRSCDGLMDAALPAEELARIEDGIARRLGPGWGFRELRTRQAGARRFIEFKLLAPPSMTVLEAHAMCDTLEQALDDAFGPARVTIHVEPSAAAPDRAERAAPDGTGRAGGGGSA